MPRPGPKSAKLPNPSALEERVEILESLVRLNYAPNGTEKEVRSTQLLAKLDTLKKILSPHNCPICDTPYSRDLGVRRHVLSKASDPAHAELAAQYACMACRRCARVFNKREQVTKHEKTCTGGE